MGANLLDHPHERYTLLAPVLIGLLIHQNPQLRSETRPALGVAMLILGLVAQVVGIAGGSWSIARWGLPVAMLGVCLITGRPAVGVTALAFALVPVPGFIRMMGSPQIESLLGAASADFLGLLGVTIETGGPLLLHDGRRFELLGTDNGIATAIVLAEVGWYSAIRNAYSLMQGLTRTIGFGLLAVIVQPIAVLACVATLPLGVPEWGRFVLTHGIWLLLCAGALLYRPHNTELAPVA
jgi:hypothetical protein